MILTEDHALIEKPRGGFPEIQQTHVRKRLGVEAEVEQVHGSVLNASSVLIHRPPRSHCFHVPRQGFLGKRLAPLPVRSEVAIVVPR